MAKLTKAEKRNQRDHYFRHQRGNKCMKCGYSKSPRALHWHHVWPEDKSFGVSKAVMDWGLEKLQKEIDKCVLLCGNCHMELHDGFWDLTPGEKRAYETYRADYPEYDGHLARTHGRERSLGEPTGDTLPEGARLPVLRADGTA